MEPTTYIPTMQTQHRSNIPQVAQNLVALGFVLFIATTSLYAQNFNKHGSRTQYQKSFFSFLFPTVKGSGNVISNERTVKPFHAIVVEDPFHAVIKQDSPYSVRVVSDGNLAEFIRTTVSNDGILTVALEMQNYEFDALAVFITVPMFDALTVGIASNTTVEAPLTLPHLTTNAGIACDITFEGGTIGKHHINADGIGSNINCVNVQSDDAIIRMGGMGASCRINAAQTEPVGDFEIAADLYYSLRNGKPPLIIGTGGKGLGVNIKALPDSTSYKTTTKRVQQPLPLAPKN